MTQEQKTRAVEIFKENPKLERLYINEKGEFFTSEDLAKNSQKEGKITSVENTFGCMATWLGEGEKESTAKEVIALVGAEIAIPQLEQQLLDEVDGKNRKSVIEAIEKRIEELKSAENGES